MTTESHGFSGGVSNDLDALETALAELTGWLTSNSELVGTPEFKKRSAAHKLLI